MTAPPPALAPYSLPGLITAAADMLASEEHRYVERFTACPAGCDYDYADTPQQIAGPQTCPNDCSYGTVEDEDAKHLDPFIDRLRTSIFVQGLDPADVVQVLDDVLAELYVNSEASDCHTLNDLRADVARRLDTLVGGQD